MTAVYDTGLLIAAEAGHRRVWADHRARLEAGHPPVVPAAVVAQASRSPRQVNLRRLLKGCQVVDLTEERAHRCGALLAESETRDVVDAAVVETAISDHGHAIVTSDPDDITRLLGHRATRIAVVTV